MIIRVHSSSAVIFNNILSKNHITRLATMISDGAVQNFGKYINPDVCVYFVIDPNAIKIIHNEISTLPSYKLLGTNQRNSNLTEYYI